MSAAEALKAARTAGVCVHADGDRLILKASVAPPDAVLDLLFRHKAGVIALLRRDGNDWSAEDWLAYFDERAGIVEFDGGLSRSKAEGRAFACCVAEWLNRNAVRSDPDRCFGCEAPEQAHDPLRPFGTETAGHAWLHRRCWSAWHAARKAQAVAALVAIGIEGRSIPS